MGNVLEEYWNFKYCFNLKCGKILAIIKIIKMLSEFTSRFNIGNCLMKKVNVTVETNH